LTEQDFHLFLQPLMAQIKLIVGLGNPGKKYSETRHNLGFMVVDFMAAQDGRKFKAGKGEWKQARITIGNLEVWAIKPKTFMNRSGLAVRMFCDYYKIEPEEVLVVCDDINLPVGKIRIRSSGSAGGHNGLKDIISNLGSDQFTRVRMGIDLPENGEPSEDYVLKRFDENEKKTVTEMIKSAVSAIETVKSAGVEAAQNIYN
jgi:peptidyl-tRNA hydrolase, PTH1 family